MLIKNSYQRTHSTYHCTPRRIEENKDSYMSSRRDLIHVDRTPTNADNIYYKMPHIFFYKNLLTFCNWCCNCSFSFNVY